MFERTSLVGTVGVEFAIHCSLMRNLLRRGWMSTSAFSILAGSAKRAFIGGVYSCSRGSCWRLMSELTVLVGARKVVLAGVVCRRWFSLLLGHLNIHGRRGCVGLRLILVPFAVSCRLCALSKAVTLAPGIGLNTIKH